MKKVSSYIYKKNNREIAVYYLNKKQCKEKEVHADDCIALVFDAQINNSRAVYMRPDEALNIAKLLIEGVNNSVKAYKMGVKKK